MNVNDYFCQVAWHEFYYFLEVKSMGALEITLGIIIVVLSAIVIACVLLQSGKDKRLSGTIAGAAETFFAKGKSKARDKMFSTITTILTIILVVIIVVFSILVAR